MALKKLVVDLDHNTAAVVCDQVFAGRVPVLGLRQLSGLHDLGLHSSDYHVTWVVCYALPFEFF
jgi:hypothetical protein